MKWNKHVSVWFWLLLTAALLSSSSSPGCACRVVHVQKGGGEPTVLTFITVTGPLTRPFLLSIATAPRWHPHPSTFGSPGLVPQVWWSGAGRDAADPADTQQRVCAESGEPFVCVTAKAHNLECVCHTQEHSERIRAPRIAQRRAIFNSSQSASNWANIRDRQFMIWHVRTHLRGLTQ